MAFQAITAGNIRGMAAIRGEPEIKNAVTGAMMLIISPLHRETASTAIMMVVLTTGPVKYTERFFKNWLAMQMASSNAVCINCFVEIFIMTPPEIINQYKRMEKKKQQKTRKSQNKNLVFFLQVCYNRIMTVGIYGINSYIDVKTIPKQ